MTQEEFNEKKLKFNQLQGLINMKLRDKKINLSFDEILKIHDVTLAELEEFGMAFDSQKGEVIKVRYTSYKDFISNKTTSTPQEIIKSSDKSVLLTDILKNEDISSLKGIIDNYSILMEMVHAYKNNRNNLDNTESNNTIFIELPFEDDKMFRKTYRVNKVIAEQFEAFCNEHKEYKVKDLISMAMKEYMEKYK